MSTKWPTSGTRKPVHTGAAGALPQTTAPSPGADALEHFLATFGECGLHKRAAEAAGLTLEAIAARRDSDPEFEQRYRLARKTRRMLIADALFEEAIGRDVHDPVNGATRRVRNIAVLQRLAITEGELEPESKTPTVAIQNNVGADPRLIAAQDELRKRLSQLGTPKAIAAMGAEVVQPHNDGSDLV